MKSDIIDLTLEILRETERAVHVHDGDEKKAVWLPKSQIEVDTTGQKPGVVVVTLPQWLARDKGLI